MSGGPRGPHSIRLMGLCIRLMTSMGGWGQTRVGPNQGPLVPRLLLLLPPSPSSSSSSSSFFFFLFFFFFFFLFFFLFFLLFFFCFLLLFSFPLLFFSSFLFLFRGRLPDLRWFHAGFMPHRALVGWCERRWLLRSPTCLTGLVVRILARRPMNRERIERHNNE